MHAVFSLLPLVAAILAVPQFLPQLARLRRTGETAGVSWSWAALTSVNNAAWAGYFALSGFWTALVPAISATVLAGALAVMLARRGAGFPRRPAALALAWTALLIAAAGLSGRAGLGTALTVAFLLQVTPSVWTAYRADRTTGIATGTWLLIFGELLCWGVFGIYESDPRLIVLGATGVTASLLVLARAARPRAPARAGSRTHGGAVTASGASSYSSGLAGAGRPPVLSAPARTGERGGTSMSWTIERRGRVAVVTMTTNPVNAQNRAFFADLHEAFDRLERDHAESPVVLTGTGTRFSAGLDLGEHFPLFAGDPAAVASWFARLPGDEHAAVHLPAPDGGRGERARLRRRPHHRRRV